MLWWLYGSEIWQASRQHCCRGACQISKRLVKSKPESWGLDPWDFVRLCSETAVHLVNRGLDSLLAPCLWNAYFALSTCNLPMQIHGKCYILNYMLFFIVACRTQLASWRWWMSLNALFRTSGIPLSPAMTPGCVNLSLIWTITMKNTTPWHDHPHGLAVSKYWL